MYTPFGTPYVYRPGLVSKVHYTMGRHTFVFGYWFDWSRERMVNPYSAVGENGGPANVWGFLGNVKLSDGTRLASYDNLTIDQNTIRTLMQLPVFRVCRGKSFGIVGAASILMPG